jgi:hypothetical protein
MKKYIYRLTGIESLRKSINPFYYLSNFAFNFFYSINSKKIIAGPFKGLVLENNRRGSEFKPKFIGTYEQEIWNKLDTFLNNNSPKLIFDIGADDGYYSIGFAKYFNNVKVISIELNSESCNHLQKNINNNDDENGIDINILNKKINSFEDIKDILNNSQIKEILIKCDIEGGEYDLFNMEFISQLLPFNVFIIIETHLSIDHENLLISNFNSFDLNVEIIDKELFRPFKKITRLSPFSKILLKSFWQSWTNESRPKFNRWICVTKKTLS